MSTAIQFDNVGKLYQLGTVGTGTISHDLNRWWQTKILRREDPYLKIGETNDRSTKGKSDFVWTLKDISFSVEQGDVVGIIGKNGAGKSTLLKLLSRVTAPTTGTIRARGRIASLLEVGTGFHPEMTGRQNIYMNGSIMGMTKAEITRKLDEIVDFAGVERYLDTPTKRYSSGMMVRLGFAVAAFLEPEILVVDEVLAVGDAEFQKKAIGKMQDVASGQGRTVLFVSHNMAAVQTLCKSGILLNNGTIDYSGSINGAVDRYLNLGKYVEGKIKDKISVISPGVTINNIEVNGSDENIQTVPSSAKYIDIKINGHVDFEASLNLTVRFINKSGVCMTQFHPQESTGIANPSKEGDFTIEERIALPDVLHEGTYSCCIFLRDCPATDYMKAYDCLELTFQGRTIGLGMVCKAEISGFSGLERYKGC